MAKRERGAIPLSFGVLRCARALLAGRGMPRFFQCDREGRVLHGVFGIWCSRNHRISVEPPVISGVVRHFVFTHLFSIPVFLALPLGAHFSPDRGQLVGRKEFETTGMSATSFAVSLGSPLNFALSFPVLGLQFVRWVIANSFPRATGAVPPDTSGLGATTNPALAVVPARAGGSSMVHPSSYSQFCCFLTEGAPPNRGSKTRYRRSHSFSVGVHKGGFTGARPHGFVEHGRLHVLRQLLALSAREAGGLSGLFVQFPQKRACCYLSTPRAWRAFPRPLQSPREPGDSAHTIPHLS